MIEEETLLSIAVPYALLYNEPRILKQFNIENNDEKSGFSLMNIEYFLVLEL